MALKKAIEVGNFGVTAEYWRITKIREIDPLNVRATVCLSGYVTQTARDEGKNPVPNAWYEINLPTETTGAIMTMETKSGNTIYGSLASALYAEIKEHDFGGTTDPETNEYTPNKLFGDAEDV